MVHAKFQDLELLILKKTIVKILAIYGHGGYLGHVTNRPFL